MDNDDILFHVNGIGLMWTFESGTRSILPDFPDHWIEEVDYIKNVLIRFKGKSVNGRSIEDDLAEHYDDFIIAVKNYQQNKTRENYILCSKKIKEYNLRTTGPRWFFEEFIRNKSPLLYYNTCI